MKVGDVFSQGRFEVMEVLKGGGMAHIYKVKDNLLNGKIWCCKEISSSIGNNRLEYKSLLKESLLLTELNNPYIPRLVLLYTDPESNNFYIIMDFIEGKSFSELLQDGKALDQKMMLMLMKQVALVLNYLHSLNNPVVYRDLKPSNIMYTSDGTIRLLDFGISEKITKDNMFQLEKVGTWGYSPPEQMVLHSKYDLRSDIFAFGRTFYTMATRTGFGKDSYDGNIPPVNSINPYISKDLSDLIMACMELNPNKRPQSFVDVLLRLDNIGVQKKKKRIWLGYYISLICFLSVLLVLSFEFLKVNKLKAGVFLIVFGVLTAFVNFIWNLNKRKVRK